MFDSVRMPANDGDYRGIFEYLAWNMQKSGMSSTCLHYLEVLFRAAQRIESLIATLNAEAYQLSAQTYRPEILSGIEKDKIYAAISALQVGLENTQDLLAQHDYSLGRDTRKNRFEAERLENEIRIIGAALDSLKAERDKSS